MTLATLTPAETRVARATLEGKSNAEIALELGLKVKTVKFHLVHIFEKLDVRSRAQLIVKCLSAGNSTPNRNGGWK